MRFDLIFSYWILVWYIAYMVKFTDYIPKFVLIAGILENLVVLFYMVRFGSNMRTISRFIGVNTVIKVIPLYTVRNDLIRMKDIIATGVYFFIYLCWLYVNEESLTGNYKKIMDSLIHNRDETPLMKMLTTFDK
jgi:hypothetical protein